MKLAFLMLRHSWRQTAAALMMFMVAWHAHTVVSLTRHVQDKVAAMAVQSAPDIDDALRRGNIVGLRNTVGRLSMDGVASIRFQSADPDGLAGRVPVAVGAFSRGRQSVIDREVPLTYNGASLGVLTYQVDVRALNSIAAGGNAALYGAVSVFVVAIVLIANMGTLRALARIEGNLAQFVDGDQILQLAKLNERLDQMSAVDQSDPVSRALLKLVQRYVREVERAGQFEGQLKMSKELTALASQVAHDIRSPLAALRASLADAARLPDDRRDVADSALARIEGIAQDLLQRYRDGRALTGLPPHLSGSAPVPTQLALLIDGVIAEKRLQLKAVAGVGLEWNPVPSPALHAVVVPSDFQRLLSNLINNAVEALGGAGRVDVELREVGDRLVLAVHDDGAGISKAVLEKLATPGFSHGKSGGSGLGLSHARAAAQSWGGRLEIESELGKGTTVRLILPRAEPPGPDTAPPAAALIDDDPLVRMNWTVAAKRAGKALGVYPDAPSFIKEAADFPRNTPVYIDSDLGGGVKGEEAAKELAALGFTELRLATGHDPASFPPLPHLKGIQGKEPPWPTA